MKITLLRYILPLFLLSQLNCGAQELLTLRQAISIALENNFEIKIAQNTVKIADTNVTLGNAGMLPTATASITDNNSIQNSSQTRQDGTTTALDNAKNNNLSYGVSIGWTIFDGLKMFAKRDQLKELQKLGDTQLKKTILTKISQVNNTYYDLVQQQQQLAALDTTIVISMQRLQLAKNRYSIGKASKLEVLNAQVDLNSDQVTLLRKKEQYTTTKILLNQHLARPSETVFVVENELVIDPNVQFEEIRSLAEIQNPDLLQQIVNKRISELQFKQLRADRYPTVKVSTGYNFSESNSSLGFTSHTTAKGLNYGFNASLNIFDGFNQNRIEKVSKLNIENANFAIEQQKLMLNTQLSTAFQTYLTNLDLLKLEQTNTEIAKQNMDITMDKFKIGTITTFEFRTAQLNYINAKVRYATTQYDAKISEIALKELAGNLNL